MKAHSIYIILICLILGCKTDDRAIVDTSEFTIAKGYEIDVVATEELLDSPVAMTEDNQGRLWVVEMPGYMRDINGSDEDLADGRIVILTDTNKDGQTDSREVFLDSLLNPRACNLIYGGLLYTDGNALLWCDIVDDRPTTPTVVDPYYVNGGNIEHQPNGLYFNLDNWLYNAKSNKRYRKHEGQWIIEPTTFRGQWGISGDQYGRLVYNHNSAPAIGDHILPNTMSDNPYLSLDKSVGVYISRNPRIYPTHAAAVNRGYEDGVLDSTSTLINYTSACSPVVHSGFNHVQSEVYVCAPEGNLIARYKYEKDHFSLARMTDTVDFLTSLDETFRPVALTSNHNGNLYVVDLRKGMIQHTAYMSSYLRELIVKRGLDKVNGLGRIYRISKKSSPAHHSFDLNNDDKIINAMASNNHNIRLAAHKTAISVSISSTKLSDALDQSTEIKQQIHLLWTLEGLNALQEGHFDSLDFNRLSTLEIGSLLPLIARYASDQDRMALISVLKSRDNTDSDFALARYPHLFDFKPSLWYAIAKKHADNPLIAEALVSSVSNEGTALANLSINRKSALITLLKATAMNRSIGEDQRPKISDNPVIDHRNVGLNTFKTYCASCHGMDGRGQKNVAPPMTTSRFLSGPERDLTKVILNGYDSGTSSYQIKMPKYKDDPKMTDQAISDLVSYLISTFGKRWGGISPQDVGKVRAEVISMN